MYSAARFNEIYRAPQTFNYRDSLNQLYTINKQLREEGISAPGDVSLENVRKLYVQIGSPLDSIPTFHIGGTNGKVKYHSRVILL